MYGMACGATVTTETAGGGRCGGWASLEHPATSKAQGRKLRYGSPPVLPLSRMHDAP